MVWTAIFEPLNSHPLRFQQHETFMACVQHAYHFLAWSEPWTFTLKLCVFLNVFDMFPCLPLDVRSNGKDLGGLQTLDGFD